MIFRPALQMRGSRRGPPPGICRLGRRCLAGPAGAAPPAALRAAAEELVFEHPLVLEGEGDGKAKGEPAGWDYTADAREAARIRAPEARSPLAKLMAQVVRQYAGVALTCMARGAPVPWPMDGDVERRRRAFQELRWNEPATQAYLRGDFQRGIARELLPALMEALAGWHGEAEAVAGGPAVKAGGADASAAAEQESKCELLRAMTTPRLYWRMAEVHAGLAARGLELRFGRIEFSPPRIANVSWAFPLPLPCFP
jgi:hypothetical protein